MRASALRRVANALWAPKVSRRHADDGEAMVVWCLILAMLLLPVGGLSIDLWRGISAQRSLESAAQDAAVAGASAIDTTEYRLAGCVLLDPTIAVQMAEANLAQQRVADVLSGVSVSVSPDDKAVTVDLHEHVALTLLRLVEGGRTLSVSASATSAPVASGDPGGC